MEGNLNIKGLNMNTQGMKKSEDSLGIFLYSNHTSETLRGLTIEFAYSMLIFTIM